MEIRLPEESAIKNIINLQEVDSTNNEAKRGVARGAADGTLYIAETQTGGKGRRGRKWNSPPGSGIFMSLLLKPDISTDNASMLTIVAAMAVASSIEHVLRENRCACGCRIKWPNDIVINKKKVCGILTEMNTGLENINYVVIGIGINVNTKGFDEELKLTASSLYLEAGICFDRNDIIITFAKEFTKYYEQFLRTQDLSGLMAEYNSRLVNTGKQVKVIDVKQSFTGTALGIDSRGELIVLREDGSRTLVSAGEVSVRGLYGYV